MSTKPRKKSLRNRSLLNEVLAVVLAASAVLLFLSLVTYNPRDPSANAAGPDPPSNLIGIAGAYLADLALQWFGLPSLIIPILLAFIAARLFLSRGAGVPVRKFL